MVEMAEEAMEAATEEEMEEGARVVGMAAAARGAGQGGVEKVVVQ